jgi:hypothetical protein
MSEMTEHELHLAGESPVVDAGDGSDTAALERRIAELERDVSQLRGREAAWRTERERLLAALEEAEREVVELPALRREAEMTRDTAYWLAVVQSSLSWRLTAPLRAVTRAGGRLRRGRRDS